MNDFRPSKKRVGIYFNDGHGITWVQAIDKTVAPEPVLVEAIQAAKREFNRVFYPSTGRSSSERVKS